MYNIFKVKKYPRSSKVKYEKYQVCPNSLYVHIENNILLYNDEGEYETDEQLDRILEACRQELPDFDGVGGTGYKLNYIRTQVVIHSPHGGAMYDLKKDDKE